MWGQTLGGPEDAGTSRTKSPRSLSTAAVGIGGEQALGQGPNGIARLGILRDARGGAAAGVEDGGVVTAAEPRADRRQGLPRALAREVHGDLPRPCHAGRAVGREELVAREAELLGDQQLDPL